MLILVFYLVAHFPMVKKNVRTVNVRLQKTKNNLHNNHEDGHLATVAIRFAKYLAILFGNNCVFLFHKMRSVMCLLVYQLPKNRQLY